MRLLDRATACFTPKAQDDQEGGEETDGDGTATVPANAGPQLGKDSAQSSAAHTPERSSKESVPGQLGIIRATLGKPLALGRASQRASHSCPPSPTKPEQHDAAWQDSQQPPPSPWDSAASQEAATNGAPQQPAPQHPSHKQERAQHAREILSRLPSRQSALGAGGPLPPAHQKASMQTQIHQAQQDARSAQQAKHRRSASSSNLAQQLQPQAPPPPAGLGPLITQEPVALPEHMPGMRSAWGSGQGLLNLMQPGARQEEHQPQPSRSFEPPRQPSRSFEAASPPTSPRQQQHRRRSRPELTWPVPSSIAPRWDMAPSHDDISPPVSPRKQQQSTAQPHRRLSRPEDLTWPVMLDAAQQQQQQPGAPGSRHGSTLSSSRSGGSTLGSSQAAQQQQQQPVGAPLHRKLSRPEDLTWPELVSAASLMQAQPASLPSSTLSKAGSSGHMSTNGAAHEAEGPSSVQHAMPPSRHSSVASSRSAGSKSSLPSSQFVSAASSPVEQYSTAPGNSMVRRAASKNATDLLDELDPDQAHRARKWGTLTTMPDLDLVNLERYETVGRPTKPKAAPRRSLDSQVPPTPEEAGSAPLPGKAAAAVASGAPAQLATHAGTRQVLLKHMKVKRTWQAPEP